MKKILGKILKPLGLEISRKSEAGTANRQIGDVKHFLEDIRARGFQPKGILDVGANTGTWIRMALDIFPSSHAILIEPQKEMRLALEDLCSRNKGIEYVEAGAGAVAGELVQTIWKDLAGSSFLPKAEEHKIKEGEQRITPIVTINDLLATRPGFSPDLVKLDIQGFEIEALKGADSCFGKTEVFILEASLYEFLPDMPIVADCISFMKEAGYDLYDITGFLRRPLDGALGQVDLAFAKSDGFLRKSNHWNTVAPAR